MGLFTGVLQVWRLDGPPSVAHPDHDKPLSALSDRGTYVATGHWGRTTVTTTNLLSEAPSQFIDTGMEVWGLALIGNVLLVMGRNMETITAWRLTEEGAVDGPPGDRSAGRSSSIWTIPVLRPTVFVGGLTAVVQSDGIVTRFDKGTGEVLGQEQQEPLTSTYDPYSLRSLMDGLYSHLRLKEQGTLSSEGLPVPAATLEKGWVKDAEGRHRLWIPPAWMLRPDQVYWLHNSTSLCLGFHVIVKL